MPLDSAGNGSEEEWDDDPSGFDDVLSQFLDKIEASEVPLEEKAIPDSQETVVTEEDEAETCTPADPIAEADAISKTGCVIDSKLEELEPKPGIEKLLRIFDDRFFGGSLRQHDVSVRWSRHMTLSAGLCQYFPKRKRCIIKISVPLVQAAPRKNLVETLLHEMIHAQLFVTGQEDGREEHGPLFTNHMARINTLGKCYITLRHTFDVKWHRWQCNGRCAKKPPHFGRIKRSSDRPPGPGDHWYQKHQETCSGVFEKVVETRVKEAAPVRVGRKEKKSKGSVPPPGTSDIRNFFSVVKKPAQSLKEPAETKTPPTPSSVSNRRKGAVDPEVIVLN